MWFYLNFIAYLISVILGSMAFFHLSKLYKKLYYKIKLQRRLSSLNIVEITNEEECVQACANLRTHCKDFGAVGFDCEWVSRKRCYRPVALLQLASASGLCCLFRLNLMRFIPFELEEILRDNTIIKLGVDPLNDAKRLNFDYKTQVHGTLDLRHLYKTPRGLAFLSKSLLDVDLDKRLKIKCSDWEKPKLTVVQQKYAAMDAFISIEIFKKWLSKKNLGKSSSDTMFPKDLKSEVSHFFDTAYKNQIPLSHTHLKSDPTKKSRPVNDFNSQRFKSTFVTRKVPLYHNCFMHAPDGELLCSCDRKKADWYVSKGLAEILPGEPFSIRLLFEPSGRANNTNEGRYYQQLKQNCCVVCGNSESYVRHKVVPSEYRKHFPNSMKDHQSHDIVLMCLPCHFESETYNRALKQKLAEECEAPFRVEETNLKDIQKLKNCAKALIKSGDIIPVERKVILENSIKEYYEVDEVTNDLLIQTINLNLKTEKQSETHGLKVVNHFTNNDGLSSFVTLWREHFINTMKPKYLPHLWSVSHNSRISCRDNKKEV